jgi:CDP-diacylglycerol-serine O-phosphatidyltransferase
MSIKKHIPNTITCANLLSGVLAIVYTLQERNLEYAAWCIVLAAVFDFFDGLVARALGVTSPIGKDLDSLADVVSFGVAPALLVYQGLSTLSGGSMLAYGVFILPAFAALRLAKFNHDERQTMSFLGLPVPSNALFWIGASFALESIQYTIGSQLTLITYLVLAVLFSALMVSDLPMFSFKLKKAPLKALWRQILLVIIAIAAILTRGWFGCSLTIIAYVFLSLLPAKEE